MSAVTRRAVLETIGLGALAAGFGRTAFAQPTALVPGTRYTYFSGSATMPGSRTVVVPDGNGGWIDNRTGQRVSIEDTASASGGGFMAYDVMHADAAGALFGASWTLLYDPARHGTKIIEFMGIAAPAGGLPDFWMPPAALASLSEGTQGGVQIARIRYPAAGTAFDAIRIATNIGNGWVQDTYDLATGLILVSSSTAQGAAVQTVGPTGTIQPGAGSTMMSISLLEKIRTTALPGPGARFPDWFKALREISYSGQMQTVIPGSNLPPASASVRFAFTGMADDHVETQRTITSMTGPVTEPRTITAGTVASLWMDPAYLASLQSGQVIDTDELLNLTMSCAGPYQNMTVVKAATPFSVRLFGYDNQTGLLSALDSSEDLSPATIRIFLRLDAKR